MEEFFTLLLFVFILFVIINAIRLSAIKSRIKRLELTVETLERTASIINTGAAVPERQGTTCAPTDCTAQPLQPEPEEFKVPIPLTESPSGQTSTTEDCAHPLSAASAASVPAKASYSAYEPPFSRQKNEKKRRQAAFENFIKKQLSIESVVTKLGILLLLIGIGYVFKLIHEKSLIREEYILLVGVFAGGALTGFGFFVRHKKRIVLAQVLFGGAIAVLYLTAFAAYVRYRILDDGIAFIFLSLITISAYILALSIDSLSVSVIGLLGSLFIPFIIDSGFFGLTSFGLYILAVAIMSSIVYFFKRWRVLQFASIVSLLSVLTKLLLFSSFTPRDAQLFLGLSTALWTIHAVPDLYVFLRGAEVSRDKICSPIAAVINFGFSLFFGFKLIPYEVLPPGSIYVFFTFLYALLSSLCLFKDRVKTLGYAYIGGTLISAYLAIIDRLQYDIEPAAVLGVCAFLYWLWRKDDKYKLNIFAHLLSIAALFMLIFALDRAYKNKTVLHFTLQALLYFVPMSTAVFLQKPKLKKIFQTLVFQAYVSIILLVVLSKLLPRHFDDLCLLYGLLLTALCALYSFAHYRFGTFFYEQSLYLFPPLAALFFTVYAFENGEKAVFPILLQLASGGAFAGLSFIKAQGNRLRFVNRLGCYTIVLKLCLIDFYFFSFVLAYPLFAAAVCILLVDRFYPNFLAGSVTAKKISKAFWAILCVWYYALYAFARIDGLDPSLIRTIINVCNGLILLFVIYTFKPRRAVFFAAVTLVVVFFSITEAYMRFENGSILTLLWGFYAIGSFIFFLKKKERRFVYTSLAFIVAVAAKLIFIDLHSLSVLSKAVTSSVFGAALLLLSYAVQPMLKKFAQQKDT
ncbi:DUF2339 domain-containing protein [Treponema sp. OMZ 840]|uniref:DUF2339 domain-containing protein n=1 Tax=Treponema sp. OMZ 840 TaxID=244313 RepID=UPI003D93ED89